MTSKKFSILNSPHFALASPCTRRHVASRGKQFSISDGFTLIELLAVMVVFMAIGILVMAILFASFRGTNKTNTLTTVRQNGNYALGQMEKTIRNAKNFDGVSTNGTDFVTNCTQIILPPPNPTPTPVPYKFITITTFENIQTTFSCCSAAGVLDATIASNTAGLSCGSSDRVSFLDTSAVALFDCKFTCVQTNASDFPIIGIDFSLIQAGQDLVQEKTVSPIPFQTSVMMRNLKR